MPLRARSSPWHSATVVLVIALAVTFGGSASFPPAGQAAPGDRQRPFTFVSVPDFLNADVADTRLRAGLGWDPGDPNSTNAHYERAMDLVLDEVAAEAPDAVFVAGDLVQGRWRNDVDGVGIFGPVRTFAQKRRAVRSAGDLYYGEWLRRFQDRGLTTHVAVGDHELGDDPWPARGGKWRLIPTAKAVWARHFTRDATGNPRYAQRPVGTPFEDTSYAVRVAPGVLLVTLDLFRRNRKGLQTTVSGGQLEWLDRVLRRSNARTVIVQGHAPALGPVRWRFSSRLTLKGGSSSPFWRLLRARGVDLYLAGEMHAVTAIDDGVVQVVHGAGIHHRAMNYLVGRVRRDGSIDLTIKRIASLPRDPLAERLWQTARKRPDGFVGFRPGTQVTGHMSMDPSGRVVQRSGDLAAYAGRQAGRAVPWPASHGEPVEP